MGKRPAARQASPMWVDTADLPTNAGHPFFERLNRVLEEAGFDAFVEELWRGVLRGADGPPESTAGPVFPSVVDRLFRRVVLRAGDRVAGGRFAESAVVSGLGRDRGGAGPLDVVAHAAADRRRDPRLGFHVGVGAARRRGAGAGEDGRHRCDDAGSERGDAEHRAAGYGRILRGFRAEFGGGVGGGDTDAGGSGSFRPVPEEQEDVEQGVEIAAGPGREDREDEGRSDALGPQGGARGRHGHGSHRLGDGAGCIGRRYGDAAGGWPRRVWCGGEDGRHRCDDVGSERGDAEH